jgi:hypothetical protein
MTAAPVGESSYYSSGSSLTVDSVAHLCRGQIARSLRSKAPIKVCLLIAGLQPDDDSSVVMGTGFFAAEQFNDKSKKHMPLIEANHQQYYSSKKQHKQQHKLLPLLLPLLQRRFLFVLVG